MATRESDFAARCESCRGYLTVLAVNQVGPALRARLDPADIVQETLLKAIRSRDGFRDEGPLQIHTWLRTILSHTLIDALRKARGAATDREQSLYAMLEESSRRLEGILKDDGSSPSHKTDRKERILLVADALARLPEDQRRAVELRHLKADPLERIAEQMGKTIPAVAGLIRRGLASLRSELAALERE